MTTGFILSLAAPVLGGMISVIIWQAKRNSDNITTGFESLHNCVHEVERKVDEMQIDVAKNYCTREELRDHIDKEEDWHDQHHQEVKELRKEFNEKTEKLSHDVAEMKDMQWNIRMDMLEQKDKDKD